MTDIDLDEGHINALHYARFTEAVEEAGVDSVLDLPKETIHRLQELSQRDWIAHTAKKNGKKIPEWNESAETDVEENEADEADTEENEDEHAD